MGLDDPQSRAGTADVDPAINADASGHEDPLFLTNPELDEEYTSLLMGEDSRLNTQRTPRSRSRASEPNAQDPMLQRRALTTALVLLVAMIVVGFILKDDDSPGAKEKIPIRRLPWW